METREQLIKDGWHEVDTSKKSISHCDNCEIGHSSYQLKILDGKRFVKTTHCHDTCLKLKNKGGETAEKK